MQQQHKYLKRMNTIDNYFKGFNKKNKELKCKSSLSLFHYYHTVNEVPN